MAAIKKVFNIQVDLKRESPIQVKGIVAGDSGNVFQITVTSDGQPLNASDIAVSRVILNVQSNNGWASQDSDLEDSGITINQDGSITVELFQETYAEDDNYAALEIYTTDTETYDTLVTTQGFTFRAKQGSQEGVRSSDAYPALIDAVNRVNEAIARMRYVKKIEISTSTSHLVITMDDGTVIDAGSVIQYVGNYSVGENLLPDAIPLTDSISTGTSTLWTVEKDAAISLPTVSVGNHILIEFPSGAGDAELQRVQRAGGSLIGHAAFLDMLAAGEDVSVSMEIKTEGPFTISAKLTNGNTTLTSSISAETASGWTRTILPGMRIPEGWDTTANGLFAIHIAKGAGSAADFMVRRIKVERSPIATAYFPATEDCSTLMLTAARTGAQAFTAEQKAGARNNLGIYDGETDPEEMADSLADGDIYIHWLA
ncbi:MAG: hypothetical protein IJP98_02285 [Clostridia bacterium]|nr:hypothetical protein [Clostridia bacterium]